MNDYRGDAHVVTLMKPILSKHQWRFEQFLAGRAPHPGQTYRRYRRWGYRGKDGRRYEVVVYGRSLIGLVVYRLEQHYIAAWASRLDRSGGDGPDRWGRRQGWVRGESAVPLFHPYKDASKAALLFIEETR